MNSSKHTAATLYDVAGRPHIRAARNWRADSRRRMPAPMTPEERDLLQRFLQDLTATRAQGKDAEAANQIERAMRASPDAAYVLVQHAIISDQALHAARDQIAQLQNQLAGAQQPAPASFLGQGAGAPPPQPSPWVRAAGAAPPPAPDQYAQAPRQSFFGPGPFQQGGGLGSFLRNAGTTAAGVAGGALLFDGLSGLFGGHRGFGGMGGFGGFGGGGWGGQPTEIIENNYYDDVGGAGGGDFDGGGGSGGGDFGGGDGGSFDT